MGSSLKTDLPRGRFFTMSAWADEASLHRFTATEPHRSVMARLQRRMGETRFQELRAPGTAVPPSGAMPWPRSTAGDAALRCGADRFRTGDLRLAKPTLYQLSYRPLGRPERTGRGAIGCG